MKKIFLLSVILCTGYVSHAQYDISVVESARELPRANVTVYSSAADALKGDPGASPYIELLDGEWKVKHTSGDYSPLLTEATGGWNTATVPESRPYGAEVTVYRTQYRYPFSWIARELFLHVGSANSPYSVYVNGVQAGYNASGRTAAEFDVTKLSNEGINDLAIVVYGDSPAKAVENHSPAGETALTGSVYVIAQPKVRVRDIYASAAIEGRNGIMNFGVIVKSHLLNPRELTVHYELYDPDGKMVSHSHRDARFEMRLEDTVRFFASIPNVRAWSAESPDLYTLQVKTKHEGRFSEYIMFRIGFRSVDAENGRLTINGWPVTLHATQYEPAANPEVTEKELLSIKEQGYNCVKVRNYPAPDYFYTLCDIIGLYVCNQADIDTRKAGNSIKKGGNPSNDPAYEALYLDRVTGMYHASKNHPSVVMFSLAENSANGYNLYESYLALKNMESERPVSYSGAKKEWNSDTAADGSFGRIRIEETPAQVTPGVSSTPVNEAAGEFRLTNNYSAVYLNKVGYRVISGRKVKRSGSLPVDIEPGASTIVVLPAGAYKPGGNRKVEFAAPHHENTYMKAPEPAPVKGKKRR